MVLKIEEKRMGKFGASKFGFCMGAWLALLTLSSKASKDTLANVEPYVSTSNNELLAS